MQNEFFCPKLLFKTAFERLRATYDVYRTKTVPKVDRNITEVCSHCTGFIQVHKRTKAPDNNF